jgi:hypothetical protein
VRSTREGGREVKFPLMFERLSVALLHLGSFPFCETLLQIWRYKEAWPPSEALSSSSNFSNHVPWYLVHIHSFFS